ncbi:septum formation initiator family protein [Saezia sanguinis]|jgi:cell division protein FtsB|uniref:septum formation initiator family protein n=1 Tax=Saezia sanguinis TaxID=1965230 RepID=UPI0030730E70
MRFLIAAVLTALLALIQYELWWGEGSSIAHMKTLQTQLTDAQKSNAQLRLRNAQLRAEVQDLGEGSEILEEQARRELGMLKPNEVLIQLR